MKYQNTNPIFCFWFTYQMTRASKIPQGGRGERGSWVDSGTPPPTPPLRPKGLPWGPFDFSQFLFEKCFFWTCFLNPCHLTRGGQNYAIRIISHIFHIISIFFGSFLLPKATSKMNMWTLKMVVLFPIFLFSKMETFNKIQQIFPHRKIKHIYFISLYSSQHKCVSGSPRNVTKSRHLSVNFKSSASRWVKAWFQIQSFPPW